ncbi:MAG TPA: radical SAM protein [Terriglobia bacterium]|nr:radical SAM protein [Terriglobia bacterium]
MAAEASGVKRLVVEVTEGCNHACLHCYNYWRNGRRSRRGRPALSRKEIRNLIQKVKRDAPLTQVALSGGEPLLRKDLPEIVCDIRDDGLSSVVITNGALLTDSNLDRYPVGSIFEVTLFSYKAELHNHIAGRPVFNRVLESLVRIEKHKSRFVLACVINKLNTHHVQRTIELGIALGADAVLVNRMNLSRHVLPLAAGLVPSASALREALHAADEAAAKYGIMIAVSVPIPPCVVDPREFPHLHFGWCPRGSSEAYYTIGCTGLLRPCNHSSVVLGDLRKENFQKIVSGNKTREFWAPVPRECRACTHPLKDSCRGGCPAASDECYGTRERMDPIVEFARQPVPAA